MLVRIIKSPQLRPKEGTISAFRDSIEESIDYKDLTEWIPIYYVQRYNQQEDIWLQIHFFDTEAEAIKFAEDFIAGTIDENGDEIIWKTEIIPL